MKNSISCFLMNEIYRFSKSLLCLVLLYAPACLAQPSFATWTDKQLTLDNGAIQRTVRLPGSSGELLTTSYSPAQAAFKYFDKESPDFQFEIGNKVYSGLGGWRLAGVRTITDARAGSGAAVTLVSEDGLVELTIRYLLYPGLPIIRKNLLIKNLSTDTVSLESVDVEKLTVSKYYPNTYSWIFSDYGRRRSVGPYEGNRQDALMAVHNTEWKQGMILGNEAAGVMKRTAVFWEAPEIVIGLTHKTALFPFRKWIAPAGSFETPQVFMVLYDNKKDPDEVLNGILPDFIRSNMGIRLAELKEKPVFVYNTWRPFKSDISEKLIMELAASAARSGIREFVIDDGWQDKVGDWGIDSVKFPHGLKPVFDYIKSLGMKPGLWVSVGTASRDSKVYHEHPEWFVKDREGKDISLVIEDNNKFTACFGTGWYDHIRKVLSTLSLEYGLEYLKLDFSIVTSPYRFDHRESGCYASGHPGHKDHNESLFTSYEYMWKLFDELHEAKPGLFIDCTFETMGGLQLIDYAMLKHAEGNWLSNFYQADQDGDLRIRNMAWWRSPAMSATALVIGNLAMQDNGWELHIKSLAGALPILLGDPRKLTATDQRLYRAYSDWLQLMASRHDIMSYRQDLAGFGEPREGFWDGYQRINSQSRSGGIVGVFRHGSAETSRTVLINFLDPSVNYIVKEAISGRIVAQGSGKMLSTAGVRLTLNGVYSGQLFEVSKK